MKYKLYMLILCIIMVLPGTTYGYAEDIQPIDLDSPKYLSLQVNDNKFVLQWRNPINLYTQSSIHYQVDFKLGRGDWISANEELPTYKLKLTNDGKTSIEIDPMKAGFIDTDINLEENSYSFRVRYRYKYIKDLKEIHVDGYFTSPAKLGFQPNYQNSSTWAFEELDRAVEYNLIPDDIRDNMKKEITREEFSEVVVSLYELQTGNPVDYNGQTFNDTRNPEVLKAASLGIVNGVGDGNFLPNEFVTRQEIAVMLKRAWAVIDPKMDFTYGEVAQTLESNIASWALEDVKFMRYKGILKGSNGLINPTGHTSREEAVILTLRTNDMINERKGI